MILHAEGHLRDGGDTDRRIALIGFDNSIEVCIEVFVKLHPRQRNGLEISKEDVEAATRNYHTKVEYFKRLAERMGNEIEAQLVDRVIWYHKLRNELYHSGNGMVPEIHVIEGARETAIKVFETLFGFDPIPSIDQSRDLAPSGSLPYMGSDRCMDFLREFSEFERVLVEASKGQGWSGTATDLKAMLDFLQEQVDEKGEELLDPGMCYELQNCIDVRGEIIKGTTLSPNDVEWLVEFTITMNQFTSLFS